MSGAEWQRRRKVGLVASAVTQVVQQLEEDGWVPRRDQPCWDHRLLQFQLTIEQDLVVDGIRLRVQVTPGKVMEENLGVAMGVTSFVFPDSFDPPRELLYRVQACTAQLIRDVGSRFLDADTHA